MDYYLMTNFAIIQEIGKRIKYKRLERNQTQQDIANRIGISRITVRKIEEGKPVSFIHYIEVLRELHLLDAIDQLFPQELPSPLEMLRHKKKIKMRASTPKILR